MKNHPKLGFCVIFHKFEENAEKTPQIFEESLQKLKSFHNVEIIPAKHLIKDSESAIAVGHFFKRRQVDLICIKLATWSSDNPVLDLSAECDVPFIFWTYPHIHAGSLCGGQQFNMVFKELGKECIFVYRDNKKALKKILRYARVIGLRNSLKKTKFLQIGSRTQGMSEVICDEYSVKKILGPRIETLDLGKFDQLVSDIEKEEAKKVWNNIISEQIKNSVKPEDGIRASKNYIALRKLLEKKKFDGITIECYPDYMGEVCLAFSLLADKGISCACEGDINSSVLMYILMTLSGQPVHHIDPLYLYEEGNYMLGSHCGCGSFQLAQDDNLIEFRNVRLANKGVCVIYPSKSGRVTMANLVGRENTYRMAVLEGDAVETDLEFPGNPIKVKLPVNYDIFLNIIEEKGIGHHWVIAYGNYSSALKKLCSLLGIDYISFK